MHVYLFVCTLKLFVISVKEPEVNLVHVCVGIVCTTFHLLTLQGMQGGVAYNNQTPFSRRPMATYCRPVLVNFGDQGPFLFVRAHIKT